jgi:hypothetical protein
MTKGMIHDATHNTTRGGAMKRVRGFEDADYSMRDYWTHRFPATRRVPTRIERVEAALWAAVTAAAALDALAVFVWLVTTIVGRG